MTLALNLNLDLLGLVKFADLLVGLQVNLTNMRGANNPTRATPVMSATGTMAMTAEHDDSSAVPVMVMATGGANVSAVNPGHDVCAAMMAVAIIVIADRQTIEPAARTNHDKASNCN